jgi:hypothetical protein
MKIYAALFFDGRELIDCCSWQDFKPHIHKVKGVVFSSFKTIQKAEQWMKTKKAQRIAKNIELKNKFSKGELMARVINTPKWKSKIGKTVAYKIELENGFNRNIS